MPKQESSHPYYQSNLLIDSLVYQRVPTQEKYPPNYYLNSDETTQKQRDQAKISNEERDELKREKLLRIYDLYKRHSLKESLDSIREKVNGLLASRNTHSNLQERETSQDSNSDISVLALRRAIALLKESIKQRSNSDSDHSSSDSNHSVSGVDSKSVDLKSGSNIRGNIASQKKKRIELSKESVNGREEIAIPVYSQLEEEEKQSTKGIHFSINSFFCYRSYTVNKLCTKTFLNIRP